MARMKAGATKAIEGPGAIKAEAEAEEAIARDRRQRLMRAERYGIPVVDEPPVDVEAERKKWERDEAERARVRAEEIERGKRERFKSDEREGANPVAVAAAIAAKVRAKPKLSEAEVERRRQSDIATARAVRYGR